HSQWGIRTPSPGRLGRCGGLPPAVWVGCRCPAGAHDRRPPVPGLVATGASLPRHRAHYRWPWTGARCVRAIRRFTIRATLPEPLAPLRELMLNLRWSWHGPARELFAAIDPAGP